jgi:hypothetical protein
MNEATRPGPSPSTPRPDDLLSEAARARKMSGDAGGVKTMLEGTRLVNDAILAQVLFALWDSGFYEYSLDQPLFEVEEAAHQLRVDPTSLRWLLDYLIGRGIARLEGGRFGLTEHGVQLSNVLMRGLLDLYVGGWGPQIAGIGPLLRGELALDDYRELRSQRHTVRGTEQLTAVRAVPAVLRILSREGLSGVLHLACRTGEFLIGLARSEPGIRGLGIDRDYGRIATAVQKARRHGVDSRLRFEAAEIGRDPIVFGEASRDVEAVVALYLLHEVGRHGRSRVVDLLRGIAAAYPGRLFVSLETLPYVPPTARRPPATFTPLDYLLIHRLRAQGLPLPPDEWGAIFEEAGLGSPVVEDVYGSAAYLARL